MRNLNAEFATAVTGIGNIGHARAFLFSRGPMEVRALTRFLVGFVAALIVIVWGEWMPDQDYVISPKGWIIAGGIGALFAAIPRLWD